MDGKIRGGERDTKIHKAGAISNSESEREQDQEREREIGKRQHAQGDLSPTQPNHTHLEKRPQRVLNHFRARLHNKSTPYVHFINNIYARTHTGAHKCERHDSLDDTPSEERVVGRTQI